MHPRWSALSLLQRYVSKSLLVLVPNFMTHMIQSTNNAIFFLAGHSPHFLLRPPKSVCAMPAARRNFFIRHGHGLFQTSQELNRTVDNVFGVAHHYMPDNYESTSCTVPQHATSSARSDDNRKDDEKYQDHMGIATVSNSITSSRSSSTTGSNPRLVESGRKTLNSKEQAWLQLLHDRPARSDQVGMANWTAKILHLSLPDNPISSMPQMQHDNSISTLWQGGGGNGFRSSTTRTVNMYEIAGQQHQDSELHGLFDGLGNISNFFD
jgi:hypothetical protein